MFSRKNVYEYVAQGSGLGSNIDLLTDFELHLRFADKLLENRQGSFLQ